MAGIGGLGGALGKLFGEGSIGQQLFLWGVLEALLQAAASPGINLIQQEANAAAPTTALTPADVADLIAKGIPTDMDLGHEAGLSGVDSGRLGLLVELAQSAASVTNAASAYRLGLIEKGDGDPTTATLTGAMADAGIRKEWWGTLEQLSKQYPTPGDVLTATLAGFYTEAEGRTQYEKLGGVPEYYDMLFYAEGNAPTPSELLELLNRGIIPEDSGDPNKPGYKQGFLQGPWRNQWLQPFLALREYLPPPRTVTAMLGSGGLTKAQAQDLLQKQGLSSDLAAAYVADATQTKTSTGKQLTESAIIDLYEAQIIGKSEATTMLSGVGYDDTEAGYLLALADMRVAISAISSAVSRIETSYVDHKTTRATAQAALSQVGVPQAQIGPILNLWDVSRQAKVATLTESSITSAWENGLMDQNEAMSELQNIGYSAFDAWVLLSIKNKKALPGKPAGSTTTVNP